MTGVGPWPEVVVVGSLNLDVTVRVERFPEPGETVAGAGLVRGGGGKGANQAVAAARLGRRVAMIGCVGDDPDGGWLVENLIADGIDVGNIARSATAPTGTAYIEVAGSGENRIVVVAGANAEVQLNAAALALVVEASATLVQLETPAQLVAELAAAPRKGQLIVNPAPAIVGLDFTGVDVLIPNETELALAAGVADRSGRERVDVADLSAMVAAVPGAPAVVVATLGSHGALVVDRRRPGTPIIEYVPATPVEVVDTTAAGDSFCGAFADAVCRGGEPVEAARWAASAAALTVKRRGAQASLPNASELGSASAG